MSVTSEIEEKLGINIASLNAAEKQTYFAMLDAVQQAQMTPEKLKAYIVSMREAVTKELVNEPEFHYILLFKVANRKQILLKARLLNYILLEAFLDSPQRAKEQFESMLAGIKK